MRKQSAAKQRAGVTLIEIILYNMATVYKANGRGEQADRLADELEALMADPAAFLERFRRTAAESREPVIAPLVEYSARRGDAGAVARLTGIAARPAAVVPASTR